MIQQNISKSSLIKRWFVSFFFFSLVVLLAIAWITDDLFHSLPDETGITIKTPAPELGLPDVSSPAKIITQTIDGINGYIYPETFVVSGVYPTNTYFAKKAEKHIKSFLEEFLKEYQNGKYVPSSFGVSADATATYFSGKKLLSYLYTDWRDDGGAHGNSVFSSETFDMNGKQYELGDLFLPNTDYLGTLSRLAIVRFAKDPKASFDPKDTTWGSGLDPKIENFATFIISGDKIIFQFQNYQIGPYSDGASQFDVSVTEPELRLIIRPELF